MSITMEQLERAYDDIGAINDEHGAAGAETLVRSDLDALAAVAFSRTPASKIASQLADIFEADAMPPEDAIMAAIQGALISGLMIGARAMRDADE